MLILDTLLCASPLCFPMEVNINVEKHHCSTKFRNNSQFKVNVTIYQTVLLCSNFKIIIQHTFALKVVLFDRSGLIDPTITKYHTKLVLLSDRY